MMRAFFLTSETRGSFSFELARELLPHRPGHLEFEQEGAICGVADNALELAEIAETGRDGTADLADHWHLDQHPER